MVSTFEDDSPLFREDLKQREDSLQEVSKLFAEWERLSISASTKGWDYVRSLADLSKSLDSPALLPVQSHISYIKESLAFYLTCEEAVLNTLDHVFKKYHLSRAFSDFRSSFYQTQELKKFFFKYSKDLEALKTQTVTNVKRATVEKYPSDAQSHFTRLHTTERDFEVSRFEFFHSLCDLQEKSQASALDTFMSLIYTFSSFNLKQYIQGQSTNLDKIAEFLDKSRSSIKDEQFKKELEALNMKLSIYNKPVQFCKDKKGYLWKQADILNDWNRRYFMIRGMELVYLRGTSERVFTSLMLSKASPLPTYKHLFAFEVFSATTQKKHILLAESETECQEWVLAITNASQQSLLGFEPEDKKECADCLAKDADWLSINLGVFVCANCSGVHRSLGSHISKVRSSALDSLRPLVRDMVSRLHRSHRKIWGDGPRPPVYCKQSDKESYIQNKYIHKLYMEKSADPDSDLKEGSETGNLELCAKGLFSGASSTYALHTAIEHKQPLVWEFLLQNGCSPDSRDEEGLTPLDKALLVQDQDLIDYLLNVLNNC